MSLRLRCSARAIHAARQPDAIALVFGSERYTYAGINERACRLANGLAALCVGRK